MPPDGARPRTLGVHNTMAEQSNKDSAGNSSTTLESAQKPRTTPQKKPPAPLPPWKVLLHNDDKNSFEFVILTILELTNLGEQQAILRTKEAHETGVALLLTTHKERAELYRDQFTSKGLTVTIEPAD